MWQRLKGKISFPNCLFVYFIDYYYCFFCHSYFSFFSSYLFCYPHFFSIRIFLSTFSHPHPPSAGIRSAFYRHPSYLGCNISVVLFKITQEVRIDVITAFFFLQQFYARMIEWQNILVAVFMQINWVTKEINRLKLLRIYTHGS